MITDIGAEAYDYERYSGMIEDRENDHSYNLWLDSKMEEMQERFHKADDGPVVWGPGDDDDTGSK